MLPRAQGSEGSPAQSAGGGAVGGISGLTPPPASGLCDPQQRLSLHLRGNRNRGDFQQSRSDVHEPNLGCDSLRGRMGFRKSYHQWDVDGLVIQEDAVGFLAVSTEAFALAGCDYNGVRGVGRL